MLVGGVEGWVVSEVAAAVSCRANDSWTLTHRSSSAVSTLLLVAFPVTQGTGLCCMHSFIFQSSVSRVRKLPIDQISHTKTPLHASRVSCHRPLPFVPFLRLPKGSILRPGARHETGMTHGRR